jgi:GNAT superfamily N-acetyltransferase
MIVERGDGYSLDTSVARLDVPLVHHWLSTDAYWALGRPAEVVEKAIVGSVCFGVYDAAGTQVAFARVVTDDATFAWLCDVYVSRPARGKGLGTWMVQVIREHVMIDREIPRLLLGTRDAHEVYARVGFEALARPERWMEIDQRPSAASRDVAHT